MGVFQQPANTNALNFITSVGIAPHPIPLPAGERDRVRGSPWFCLSNLVVELGIIQAVLLKFQV